MKSTEITRKRNGKKNNSGDVLSEKQASFHTSKLEDGYNGKTL